MEQEIKFKGEKSHVGWEITIRLPTRHTLLQTGKGLVGSKQTEKIHALFKEDLEKVFSFFFDIIDFIASEKYAPFQFTYFTSAYAAIREITSALMEHLKRIDDMKKEGCVTKEVGSFNNMEAGSIP